MPGGASLPSLQSRSKGAPNLRAFMAYVKTIGKWWFNGGLMRFNQQNGDFNGMYPLVMSK